MAQATPLPLEQIRTFEEFWPFYLGEHSDPRNRRLHFVGTNLMFATLITMLATQNWLLLPLLPILGYGFAWFGHFVIEKNKPASFKHPLWSLIGDFKMCGLMWLRKL